MKGDIITACPGAKCTLAALPPQVWALCGALVLELWNGRGMAWRGYGMYCPAPGCTSMPGTQSNPMVPGSQYLGSLVPSPVPRCCLSLALPMPPALQGLAGFDFKQDLVPP